MKKKSPFRGPRHSGSGNPFRSDRPERSERMERGERPERNERGPKRFGGKAHRNDRKDHNEYGTKPKRHHDASPRHHGHKPRLKRQRPERDERPAERYTPSGNATLIWGFHAARAAWLNPKRRITRLWLTEAGQNTFEETVTSARDELLKRPDAKRVERPEMDRLLPPGSVHQGIVLEVAPLHEPSLQDVITGDNPPDCLIMLDQVTDPHNIGAILRSAAALGAGAVILTERNAPGMTGVLAKSASGAAEHVPQIHVVNLARALDELRQAGYWSVGLAEEGEKNLADCDLSGRTVLVMGSEGEGLRQLTRKKCDELARLPTSGPVGSLNVSNAAAVALYEAKRQKKSV